MSSYGTAVCWSNECRTHDCSVGRGSFMRRFARTVFPQEWRRQGRTDLLEKQQGLQERRQVMVEPERRPRSSVPQWPATAPALLRREHHLRTAKHTAAGPTVARAQDLSTEDLGRQHAQHHAAGHKSIPLLRKACGAHDNDAVQGRYRCPRTHTFEVISSSARFMAGRRPALFQCCNRRGVRRHIRRHFANAYGTTSSWVGKTPH